MPINPEGAPCHCGSTGCWETEIGEDALLRLAGQHERGGRAAMDRCPAPPRRRRAAGRMAALDHVGRWLGIGLAGLVTSSTRAIVLGGRFGRLLPYRHCHASRPSSTATRSTRRATGQVVPAELGEDAPLLGAAELAFEPFLADPGYVAGSPFRGRAARSVSSSTDGRLEGGSLARTLSLGARSETLASETRARADGGEYIRCSIAE